MARKSILAAVLAAAFCAFWGATAPPAQGLDIAPNGYYFPDYFLTPNWANSPPLPKFVDNLAGLTAAGANNLGQYMPVANPDNVTYPGCDYYEIGLVEYSEKLHSNLPPTRLRGYYQKNLGSVGPTDNSARYLGPLIIAHKDRPVRIRFTNELPTGAGGNLFLPVDNTIMGSGMYSIDYDPATKNPIPLTTGEFSQNRATIHLHGGRSPWISDGTPHQWTVPAGEATSYPKGVSVSYVPDMWFDNVTGAHIPACAGQTTCAVAGATNDPGPGSLTFYYTNQQSARLMFYHDHAYGITRLNVYAGEAAGYLLQDNTELKLVADNVLPADQIPLIIQDKTFVDNATIGLTDPTWAWGTQPGKPVGTPVTGDLWWPHVYMPAQNPYDITGMNMMGRWMYGPWFFPPTPTCGSSPNAVPPLCIANGPVPNPYANPANPNYSPMQPPEVPGSPNPSWGAEAFLDTMLVNGTVYPSLTVDPKPYRLRVLNASHDRFLNLQFYKAVPIVSSIVLDNGGTGYTSAPFVTITGATTGTGATATATVDLNPLSPTYTQVTAITLDTVGSGYDNAIVTVTGGGGTGAAAHATLYTAPTEVGMVPASLGPGIPAGWPADGREGGVPDPATRGPAFIQIGSEGGFLPAPSLIRNQPVQWNTDPTMFNFGNVLQQRDGGGTVFLGPAERADLVVDFSRYAGQTLILYNDAPTAFPALDPHYDYYTNAPDRTGMGGYGPIPPGVGPNVRTVMQVKVTGAGGLAPADDFNPAILSAIDNAFRSKPGVPGVFAASQEPIIVGQAAYNTTYDNTTFPSTWPNWGVSRIGDTSISFMRVDNTIVSNFAMLPKAIHDEMGAAFDDYGRMAAKLGLEVPFVNAATQTFILQNFVDPATEIVMPDNVQIWKITHNGVDTHPIHFHLFDVQVLNRVGWDGFIRLPDENELGWKETVRISPLEDTIVALRPALPRVPFKLPNNIRPLNPTAPLGDMMGFSQTDITTGGPLTPMMMNQLVNNGYEYMWHCHILSHEENDMMRTLSLVAPPEAPYGLGGTVQWIGTTARVSLSWTDNSANETGFTIQRATDNAFTLGLATAAVGANVTAYVDNVSSTSPPLFYRVFATNTGGGPAPSYPTQTAPSGFSNTAAITLAATSPPTNVAATLVPGSTQDRIVVTWTDTSTNESGFRIQRATDNAFTTNVVTSQVNANVTTFTSPLLPHNGSYFFRVQSYNAQGSSPWANATPFPILTTVDTMPAAPSGVTATKVVSSATQDRITVTWTDNSNNETGFRIQMASDNAFTVGVVTTQVNANTTSFTSALLAHNLSLYFRVQSYNGGGASAYVNATPFPVLTTIDPPAAPTGVTATKVVASATQDRITVTWTDASNNETGFRIQMASDNAFTVGVVTTQVNANTTSFTSALLAHNLTLYFRVQSYNAVSSAWVNATPFPVATTVDAAPAAPSNVTASGIVSSATQARATLAWTDNSGNETGFRIQMATDNAFTVGVVTTQVNANTTSFTSALLPRGASYYFRVQSYNGGGASAYVNATPFPVITP
jgi:FtsP/CotA-like multicopper oxidase with cupredoxin domain